MHLEAKRIGHCNLLTYLCWACGEAYLDFLRTGVKP